MRRHFSVMLGFGFLATLAMQSQATLIVDTRWGDTVVGANAELTGPEVATTGDFNGDATSDYRRSRAFSESSELSPNITKAGYNTDFFGGWQMTYYGTTTANTGERTQVRNVTGDPITIMTGTDTREKSVQALVFWKNTGYQNVTGPDYATFVNTATNSIAVTLAIDGTMPTFRYLVKTGGQYYVSETTFTATATLTNPGAANWAAYNPATDMNFNQASATYGGVSFGELEAVGYYFETDSSTASIIGFRNTGVVVQATLVPEPATAGMLLLGLSGVFLRRRAKAQA